MKVESLDWYVTFGFVRNRKSFNEENVLPPKCPVESGGGRKNTPYRKMLNELKNENRSKFAPRVMTRSEEHTSELQSPVHLVCRLLLEKKNKKKKTCIEQNRVEKE